MTTRHQDGCIFEAYGAFHIKYYTTVLRDGKTVRAQRSRKLCRKDSKYFSATCRRRSMPERTQLSTRIR